MNVYYGDHELFVGEAIAFANRAKDAGVDVSLISVPAGQHNFILGAGRVPEVDEAVEKMGRWLRSKLWQGATEVREGNRMSIMKSSDAAKAVVRQNTEEVQGRGNFEVFDKLFADDFVDHTPQPNMTPDKAGVRQLYRYIRDAFPDFHAEIHWQLVDGDRVTTYKTYYGTHDRPFLGIAPTHRKIHFESVDVMRVQNGKITDHWGVGNLLSLLQQIGAWKPPPSAEIAR
jgi:steroid delta-isomerase-like uncharacterized protein